MSQELTASELKTPPLAIGHTIARPRVKRQFSLATLLLFVLWLASGYSIWFYWQSWVVVGEYENIENQVWYSQDGSKLMVAKGNEVGEIDVRTGALVGRSSFNPPLSWWWRPSVNGDWVICDRSETKEKPAAIEIHNKQSGKLEQTLEGSRFSMNGHFSADGERLFNCQGGLLDVYRWKKGELEWRIKSVREERQYGKLPPPPLKETGEKAEKRRICERAVFAAQSLSDLTERVENLARLPLGHSQFEALLSPNADLAVTVLSTRDATRAFSWDLSTGQRIAELEGFRTSEPGYEVFSDDGRCLGAVDAAGGKAAVWDLATGRAIATWKIADGPCEEVILVLSRDARLAATQSNDGTWIWECSTGRLLSALPPNLGHLTFFPDARRVAGTKRLDDSANMELFDTESGERLCTLSVPAMPCAGFLKCSPDGQSVAVVGANPGGATARVFWRHHPESAYGWLAMPVAWVFIALTLLQLGIFLRRSKNGKPA